MSLVVLSPVPMDTCLGADLLHSQAQPAQWFSWGTCSPGHALSIARYILA